MSLVTSMFGMAMPIQIDIPEIPEVPKLGDLGIKNELLDILEKNRPETPAELALRTARDGPKSPIPPVIANLPIVDSIPATIPNEVMVGNIGKDSDTPTIIKN